MITVQPAEVQLLKVGNGSSLVQISKGRLAQLQELSDQFWCYFLTVWGFHQINGDRYRQGKQTICSSWATVLWAGSTLVPISCVFLHVFAPTQCFNNGFKCFCARNICFNSFIILSISVKKAAGGERFRKHVWESVSISGIDIGASRTGMALTASLTEANSLDPENQADVSFS